MTIFFISVRFTKILIENIVLQQDKRNISRIQTGLPDTYIDKAAKFLLSHKGEIWITTGFYVNGTIETDGPIGAIGLAKALHRLGYDIRFILDSYSIPFFNDDVGFPFDIIQFPIMNHRKSKSFARNLLRKYSPSVIIAIERCGMTTHGGYRNCRGNSITQYTAKVDYLFHDIDSIGIGDGGNEIGMGNLQDSIRQIVSIEPCITIVDHLIISSVSNWGVYGLIAYLSKYKKKNLLPAISEIKDLIELFIQNGAIDGITGKRKISVDGFSITQIESILTQLHHSV